MGGNNGIGAERLLIAASLLGVAIFVAVGIERPLWLDEANSALIASRGFVSVIDSLRHENNLPGYYFLLSLWMRIFGDSEIALRSLSAIFYLAGCAAAGALGKRLSANSQGGWYAAFFYACSPLAIRNAQNIRMYALLGLLSGLSILIFLRLFTERDRSWRGKAWFIVINAAGLATHVWFVFVLTAQLLALIFFERREVRRFVVTAAAAATPMIVLWGRFFLEQTRNGATDWMAPLSWGVVVTEFTEFYGYFPAALLYGLMAITLVLAPVERRRRVLEEHRIRLLAFVFAASLALPSLVCAVRPIYWPGRYTIIALPAIAAVLGAVLAEAAPRPLLSGVCLLFLGFGVATQIAQRKVAVDTQLPDGQSDRTTAAFLLQHAAPGDAVVFTSLTRAVADYYFGRAHASGRFLEISFPQEVAGHLAWADSRVSPARRVGLEAEAAATSDRLRRIVEEGHNVWLYDGYTAEVNEILKDKLDTALALRQEYPLNGPNHRRILEYTINRQRIVASAGAGALSAVNDNFN